MPFEAKVTRARWVLGPFTSEDMMGIATVLRDTIAERIGRGINCADTEAKPLKPGRNGRRGYPDYKVARGLQGIRDWFWTGRTMRSLKVKAVSENRAVIGFTDPNAELIAHVNNLREKAFGVSPTDCKALNAVVLQTLKRQHIIQFRKVA